MEEFIRITKENIDSEHICCAFSDKKCTSGYQAKKDWLKGRFEQGYVFERLDERAKVFMEYGPSDQAWVPVIAPGYLMINCFWVSGKYKGQGYAKHLLEKALQEAENRDSDGLITVVGTKKYHFMSDTKWFLKQGFVETHKTDTGFSLLVRKLKKDAADPKFTDKVIKGSPDSQDGLVVYYSNRCPFAEFHVQESLPEALKNKKTALKVIKLDSQEKAMLCPSPATIFSLFYKGEFVTTDISVCLDSRFEKIMSKAGFSI